MAGALSPSWFLPPLSSPGTTERKAVRRWPPPEAIMFGQPCSDKGLKEGGKKGVPPPPPPPPRKSPPAPALLQALVRVPTPPPDRLAGDLALPETPPDSSTFNLSLAGRSPGQKGGGARTRTLALPLPGFRQRGCRAGGGTWEVSGSGWGGEAPPPSDSLCLRLWSPPGRGGGGGVDKTVRLGEKRGGPRSDLSSSGRGPTSSVP